LKTAKFIVATIQQSEFCKSSIAPNRRSKKRAVAIGAQDGDRFERRNRQKSNQRRELSTGTTQIQNQS